MFRIFSIAALALIVGCQSASNSRGCFDEGHIRAVNANVISFCAGTSFEPGAELSILVPQPRSPRRGQSRLPRKKVGTATVLSQSAEGVQARLTSGYARVGAHVAK